MEDTNQEQQAFTMLTNDDRNTKHPDNGYFFKKRTIIVGLIAVIITIILVGVVAAHLGPSKTGKSSHSKQGIAIFIKDIGPKRYLWAYLYSGTKYVLFCYWVGVAY